MPETKDARERAARRSAEAQGLRVRKVSRNRDWNGYVLTGDAWEEVAVTTSEPFPVTEVLTMSAALDDVERFMVMRRDGLRIVPAPLDGLRVAFGAQDLCSGYVAPVAGWLVLPDGAWVPLVPLGEAIGPNPLLPRTEYSRDRLWGRDEIGGDLIDPADIEGES